MKNLGGNRELFYGGGELEMVYRRHVCKERKLSDPSLTFFLGKLGGLFASLIKRAECFGVSCNTFAGMGDD